MATEEQLQKNYEAFVQKLPDLLPLHNGKFALMYDGEIVEFFDSARDAYVSGSKAYPDQNFTIQEVTDKVANLGFLSYALS
jgi:hypothetical protein